MTSPKTSEPGPTVLVGIITHNRAGILQKSIQSALQQSYAHVQVAVVDDASIDETAALAARFPSVRWTRFDSPRGYLEARNLLMRESSADYYLSLDDDAWFMGADEIAVAIDYLERNRHVAALALDILSPDRATTADRTAARPTNTFIGCGHVLRLNAVREAGYYTPGPEPYGAEEKDLCLRLRDCGHEVYLMPGVHVWHDKAEVGRDLRAQQSSNVCNDLAFALRRCPLPLLIVVLPYKVLSHFRYALRHNLLAQCFRGVGRFLRHFPSGWKHRAPVSATTFQEFLSRSHSGA
ncbi:MAG: glycosyltransferase [Pirellulales bacterium]